MTQRDSEAADQVEDRRRRPSRAGILRGAAFAVFVGVVVAAPGVIARLTQDPYQRAAEEAGSALIELPGFEERFGAIDEEDAFDVGAQIGLAAIPRLPDAELTEYLALTRSMLVGLDADACAAILRGTADAEALTDAFRTLDLDTFRRYLELVTHGARIVLAGPPAPEPVPGELEDAIGQLTAELGTARMIDVADAFVDPSTTDSELCVAANDLYQALEALGPSTARVLLTNLVAAGPST